MWIEFCALIILDVLLVGVIAPKCINEHDGSLFWVAVFCVVAAPIITAGALVSFWGSWRRFRQTNRGENK